MTLLSGLAITVGAADKERKSTMAKRKSSKSKKLSTSTENTEQKDVDSGLEKVQGGIYDDSDSAFIDDTYITPSNYNER